jgi:hypothetical protein
MRLIKNYYFLIFPGLILLFLLIIEFSTKIDEVWLKMLIVIPLAYILSPRIKVIRKPYGKLKQLRWLFSKKIIYIKLKA